MDHGQHFTFCCLDHSDLNSRLKNLNTSNASLTLGYPGSEVPLQRKQRRALWSHAARLFK